MADNKQLKWWGWGMDDQRYDLPASHPFWSYLESKLGPFIHSPRLASLNDIKPAPGRLSPEDLSDIEQIFGKDGVSIDPVKRLMHAMGKSYVDLLRMRQGWVDRTPDAVVFPEKESQIQASMAMAANRGWSLVPFGGGTSVVGGVEPFSKNDPVITLDLVRMNRILHIDRTSHTACVQCGIRGPQLEAQLNAAGFTLGHFPQSFEFSSLGGWIATRSAGQNSTKYGKIEQMVVSIRIVTPDGILNLPEVPADAAGPSLLNCFIGSEGTLGVMTQAAVRLHPLSRHRGFASHLFTDFLTGLEAVRELLQNGMRPAVVRLSDPDETAMAYWLSKSLQPSLKDRLAKLYLRMRAFDLQRSAVLILIFEESRRKMTLAGLPMRSILKSSAYLGSQPARRWAQNRFRHPYLRDDLMDRGVMVDSLETAAPWHKLPALYAGVRRTLLEVMGATATRSLVLTHLSHAYLDGASLYFTFLARQQQGKQLQQWQRVKAAATEAVIDLGGALSHHHGIGQVHRPWMRRYLTPEGAAVLSHLKDKLDPRNIMNPGKLFGE
jgi:alkyldihydroxyacetonephosphate synthase